MSETRRTRVDWRRILAESTAVVLSILLAFAVDAWWDGRQARIQERTLLEGLLADFESSRPGLVSRVTLARRMAAGNAGLLELAPDDGLPGLVDVPDSLVLAVLGGPTYEPATNTLDAALASGEIEILRSATLRGELANWRRILADTGEDEREVRRVTNEQLAPLLARSLDLRPYYDGLLAWSGGDEYGVGRRISSGESVGAEGRVSFEMTGEVVAALSIRRFYAEFSAADLEELLDALDRCIGMLAEELGRTTPAPGDP